MKTFERATKTFIRVVGILLLIPVVPGMIFVYLMLWAWDRPTDLLDESNALWYGLGIIATMVYLIFIPWFV